MNTKIDKDLFINPFPLSDKDKRQIQNLRTSSLNERQFNEVIFLLDLCDNVAEKNYDIKDAYEWAVRGLRKALMHYRDEKRDKDHDSIKRIKLTTYATWFMNDEIDKIRKEMKNSKKD